MSASGEKRGRLGARLPAIIGFGALAIMVAIAALVDAQPAEEVRRPPTDARTVQPATPPSSAPATPTESARPASPKSGTPVPEPSRSAAPSTPAETGGPAEPKSSAPPPRAPDDQESSPAATEPLELAPPRRGPIGAPKDEEIRASESASSVVEAVNQIGRRSDGSAIGADAIATGFVLGELESFAQEQRDLGYRQVGEARVTKVTVAEAALDADPPTMTLIVCVDVSDVDVLDAQGNSLGGALYDPGRPVKHLYGAQFEDDVWKISTHEIPDHQDCPIP